MHEFLYQGKSVIKKDELVLFIVILSPKDKKIYLCIKKKEESIYYIIVQSLLIDILSFNYSSTKESRSVRSVLRLFFEDNSN